MKSTVFQLMTKWGLILFAFTIPVSFVPGEFGVGIAFCGWFLEGLVNRNWQVKWHPMYGIIILYLGWNILSAALSVRPLHSLLAVGDNEWPVVLMTLMFWTVRTESELKSLTTLFLAVSGITMVYAIWQTFAGIEYYRHMALTPMEGLFRNVGFYSFYLTFAALAMSVFFLSATLMLEHDGSTRRWYAIVAVTSLVAVVGSFARSIWLALALAAPLLGFIKSRKFGLVVIGSLTILTLALIAFAPAFRDRILSILDLSQNETRLNLWRTSLAIVAHKPILGVGQDNFDYFFPLYRVQGYYNTATHPHNDYLNVLVSSGIPGFLGFLGMWGMTLWVGFTTWRKAQTPLLRGASMGASLAIVGFLVGSFFQDYYGTFANCLGWWFLVGIVFSCARLTKSEPSVGHLN